MKHRSIHSYPTFDFIIQLISCAEHTFISDNLLNTFSLPVRRYIVYCIVLQLLLDARTLCSKGLTGNPTVYWYVISRPLIDVIESLIECYVQHIHANTTTLMR